MKRTRSPWILGVGAVAVAAGCAQPPLKVDSTTVDVAPVYRTSRPAGTAAGQYAVGRIDLSEGRIDSAIRRFRQALELEPTFIEAHNGLGVAYGQQGRYGEAEAAFRDALALAPDAPHLLNNLGFARMKAGRLDDAWIALKRALELDTHNVQTRENLKQLAELRRAGGLAAEDAGTAASRALAAAASPVAGVASVPVAVQPAPAPGAAGSSALATTVVEVAAVAAPPVVAPHPVARPAPSPSAAVVPASPASPVAAPLPMATPAPASMTAPAPQAGSSIVQLAPNLYELRYPETLAAVAPAAALTLQQSVQPSPVVRASSKPAAATASAPTPRAIEPPRHVKEPFISGSTVALDGVEVANGVGIRHLAGRTARKLTQLGMSVLRVSDYQVFGRQRTEIQYRNGHLADAQTMLRSLPVQARLVKSSRLHEGVNLRLVVGRDLVARKIAWLEDENSAFPVIAAHGVPELVSLNAHRDFPLTVALKPAGTNPTEGWRLL